MLRLIKGSVMRADFSSQDYFRNPAAEIEKLRSAGPVVDVRFPIVGKIWTTTTQDLRSAISGAFWGSIVPVKT